MTLTLAQNLYEKENTCLPTIALFYNLSMMNNYKQVVLFNSCDWSILNL